jgi:hypothetical protein
MTDEMTDELKTIRHTVFHDGCYRLGDIRHGSVMASVIRFSDVILSRWEK